MPLLMLKDLPRYECLLDSAKQFPSLDPSAAEVYLHLLRTSDEVFRATDAHLSAHRMSQGRFTVLMLLLDKATNQPHARTPAELADLAGVTRATMTGLVDTLEKDGFVRRDPDPHDRRMMSVALTAEGHGFLGRFLPEHFQRIAAMMARLSESERRLLVSLLGRVVEGVAELSPAPSATPAVKPDAADLAASRTLA
jgi:DNA-binding MarR family transcriptional regulator